MFELPAEVDVPADQRAHATLPLRYEDVTQDGRLQLLSLPHAIGAAVWAQILNRHPLAKQMQKTGVVPIMTRLIIEGGGGPIGVARPIEVDGSYRLAHTVDERGEVNRLVLETRAVCHGLVGRTHGPPPPNAGERVFVGRIVGENTFTRLFAPPEARKVTRFEVPGVPDVPPDRYAWRTPESLLELPPDAEPLDEGLLDESIAAFGITHTDSNQHVNSMVYPRLFEDAALRRLAARGRKTAVISRHCEIAYRKPAFAGERLRLAMRAFAWGGRSGAVGVFRPVDSDRPHCTLRILFEE